MFWGWSWRRNLYINALCFLIILHNASQIEEGGEQEEEAEEVEFKEIKAEEEEEQEDATSAS